MAEEFKKVDDLKRRYGLPVSWFYTKAESGELPSYKVGKYRLFKLDEVDRYFEGKRQGPRAS